MCGVFLPRALQQFTWDAVRPGGLRACQNKCVSRGPDRVAGRSSPRRREGHDNVTEAGTNDDKEQTAGGGAEADGGGPLLRQAGSARPRVGGPGGRLNGVSATALWRGPE